MECPEKEADCRIHLMSHSTSNTWRSSACTTPPEENTRHSNLDEARRRGKSRPSSSKHTDLMLGNELIEDKRRPRNGVQTASKENTLFEEVKLQKQN